MKKQNSFFIGHDIPPHYKNFGQAISKEDFTKKYSEVVIDYDEEAFYTEEAGIF